MIDFEQWYEQEGYGLAFGSDENSDCYFGARDSWNYQQAKIDELQKKLDCCREENKAHLEKIDDALNTLCKLQYSSGERIYNDVGNILKGNKDEN